MRIQSKFKIGDRVQIICGKEKGKIGKITLFNKKKGLVTLDSIPNKKIVKKIAQNTSDEGDKKTDKEIPRLFNISNVMLWDEKANKASRIGIKIENFQKKRIFKKTGNFL